MNEETFRTGISVDFDCDIDEKLIEPISTILKILEYGLKNKDLFDDDSFNELDEMLTGSRKTINIIMEHFERVIFLKCIKVQNYKDKQNV